MCYSSSSVDWTIWLAFTSYKPWMLMTLSSVHQLSFPGLLLVEYCILETCHFGNALTQTSRHSNLVLVGVIQILTLVCFSCSQHIIFKNC